MIASNLFNKNFVNLLACYFWRWIRNLKSSTFFLIAKPVSSSHKKDKKLTQNKKVNIKKEFNFNLISY